MAYKRLYEFFKQVLDYKGHKIFDVEHSMERYKSRVGFDFSIYKKLLQKGIDWIVKNNKENTEDRYIFISKKHGFGIQVHWRSDRYDKKFHGFSATTLSQNEMNYFTKADKQLFLENAKKFVKEIKTKLTESEIEKMVYKSYYKYNFEGELKKETDLVGLDLFIETGKIYKTYEFIEV